MKDKGSMDGTPQSIVGIRRAERFSPNSVGKDEAILRAVLDRLHGLMVREEDAATALSPASVYLNMARSNKVLALLKAKATQGALVLNPAEGVEACRRSRIDALMHQYHLPLPPLEGHSGYWLKRGDAAAQEAADVVFCEDEVALAAAKERFAARHITDYVVQAHVRGDLVKFYGVEPTGFFRVFYPGDDGESKFGNEQMNGRPHHYFYQKQHLQASAELLSRLAHTPIYGGDAIITPDGDFVLIDFNDWPSFSRCVDEAATHIAQFVNMQLRTR